MKLFDFLRQKKKISIIISASLAVLMLVASGVFFYLYETDEITEKNIHVKKIRSSMEGDSPSIESNDEISNSSENSNMDTGYYDYSQDNSDEFDINDLSDTVEDYSVNKSFVPAGYKKVWGDDFNADFFDTNKWSVLESTDKDTIWSADSDVLSVTDGKLKLTTKHYFDPYSSLAQYKLPAEINTIDTMNFQYGYLEMCARVPFKVGAWPSLWMRGINGVGSADRQGLVGRTDYGNDAYATEIDIFENFATQDTVTPNLHKWYSGAGNANITDNLRGSDTVNEYRFSYLENLSNEYHVYGFEWTDTVIKMYVDGEVYCTFDITEKGNFDDENHKTDMIRFHDPHYLIIWNNLHTPMRQDYKVTNPSDLPFNYDIDWIHLYQKPGLGKIYIKGSN